MEVNNDITHSAILEDELQDELVIFESFFGQMGFKRIDGSIYGLLVLSQRPLSSEEIQRELGISQSAISMSIKNMSYFGIIDTKDDRENRCKVHSAKEDSLSIISSILRKRELSNIEAMKHMAKRVLAKSENSGADEDCPRNKKLQSIVLSCEIAESIINFIVNIGQLQFNNQYAHIAKKLPQIISTISANPIFIAQMLGSIKNNMTSKIKEGLSRISGEH